MKKFWNELDSTLKVLVYLSISTVLAEILVELGGIEQTFIVRVSAQIVNLVWVFLEKRVIPEVRKRTKK